jgi:hypothetical protein
MKPRPAVGPHSAEEGQADTVVVQQVGSLTGKFRLLGLEVAPRDHVERAWQIHNGLSTARVPWVQTRLAVPAAYPVGKDTNGDSLSLMGPPAVHLTRAAAGRLAVATS